MTATETMIGRFTGDDLVLVTGATGFTGSVLVRKLAERGCRIRAVARNSSDISPLADLPVEWIRGDIYDPEIVQRAVRGVTYVFSLATAYREGGASDDVFRKVHVEATHLLAETCSEEKQLKRFVHVSTVGVHGHIETPPADEQYRFAPGDAYQETKLEAELWIRDYARVNMLPLTVLRPAGIFGPGDRRLLKLFRMASRPVFPVLGSGDTWYHLIHVDDLCESMLLAAVHPAAEGNVFICGNREGIRLTEIGRIISDALGRPTRVVRLPLWPFMALAGVCEGICRPLGLAPPIYRRRVAFYTKDRCFDTRRLHEGLGFLPEFDNESGLRSTANWYRENGWIGGRTAPATGAGSPAPEAPDASAEKATR